ncbi:helix-turn-helix DNA binding domain protein [Microbacterium phage Naby]|uniref:Helix-turn-helix DNA binding domain protein n=1 Tax=Microbacterium phage BonaeVitae TaxID=2126925 RepID=A0A2R3ZZR0_9CAUD|nr:DNA binding protein [Microbacterium phage BonaeVitae]AVR56172.1 helix-turn-helix DNA binding domain protein [Microbacterium phage BonaeVitae]QFG10664.1 helix-turn-helix DNA binding domain protein [Microbacterium phage Naby]
MEQLIDIETFAQQRNVATRTVRRWLDAGRIAGAVKPAGKWLLPADAIVAEPLPGTVATRDSSPAVNDMASVTVPAILAPLPVMLPLDVASRVLGVSEYTLRRNADYFELQRLGAHGSYVMPKRRVRELEGA